MRDPKKRRHDLTKRTLTYIFMTFSVVALVVISLFLVLGYSVDKKGQPEQGGLVQFRSFPTGASVHIDGSKQGFTTNGKRNISSGYHTVNMDLKKYRGWSKSFDLGSGELLWLNALLVPKDITTSEVLTFENLGSAKFSPNKEWLAVVDEPSIAKVQLIDLRDEKKPVVDELAIPEIVAGAAKAGDQFKVHEWDSGSRYILVSHTTPGSVEWLRLDRTDPGKAKNISVLENASIQKVVFVGDGGSIFYILSDGNLRRVDISKTDEKSDIIAANVREFELYGEDRLAFVAQDSEKQVVSFYDESKKKLKKVREYALTEQNVHTSLGGYFSENYQIVSHGSKIEVIKDPLASTKVFAKFSLLPSSSWVYFSGNSRFAVAQYGSNLSVYDLERKQNFVFGIPGNPAYELDHHLGWLDDYRFASDVGNTLSFFEYDGTNIETIGNIVQGYDTSLGKDGKRLFSFGRNTVSNKPVLRSSVMVVE